MTTDVCIPRELMERIDTALYDSYRLLKSYRTGLPCPVYIDDLVEELFKLCCITDNIV